MWNRGGQVHEKLEAEIGNFQSQSQGTLGAPGSWKRQERILPQSLQREHDPTNTWIFYHWFLEL